MKIYLITLCLMTTLSAAFAQTGKPAWQEMKTFHSFMSSTFHPAEDGNFVPLKSKADSLLITAKLWQASPIASNYKPVETKAALQKLVKQCTLIKTAVKKNASDEKLKKLISDAHDIFHTIVGECRKADE